VKLYSRSSQPAWSPSLSTTSCSSYFVWRLQPPVSSFLFRVSGRALAFIFSFQAGHVVRDVSYEGGACTDGSMRCLFYCVRCNLCRISFLFFEYHFSSKCVHHHRPYPGDMAKCAEAWMCKAELFRSDCINIVVTRRSTSAATASSYSCQRRGQGNSKIQYMGDRVHSSRFQSTQ
jgi:hypothetical protein